MTVATAVLALVAILATVVFFWLRSRSSGRRYELLADKINRLKKGRNTAREQELLRQAYQFVYTELAAGNQTAAYQAVDLVKTAFGAGVLRQDEPLALTGIVVGAMRSKQPDIAGAALEAFRLLLKRQATEGIAVTAQQLSFIAAVAIREKQSFLAAKAAEIACTLLERPDLNQEQAAAAETLKTIGVLALRRRDGGLFRDLTARMGGIICERPDAAAISGSLAVLSGVWLHRIVQNNDSAMFAMLADFIARLADKAVLSREDICLLVKEWQNLAGTATLNPTSELGMQINGFTLRLMLAERDEKAWEQAVAGAGQVARLAIRRGGVKEGFSAVLPLFEIGRELLALELKFGSAENAESFRQQALYAVVKEGLALADFAARQDLVITVGDSITEFYRQWLARPVHPGQKTVKRFCQLLAAYWMRTRARQASKAGVSEELATPVLLSDADRQRLAFLL